MLEGYRWTDFVWPAALSVAFVASTPWGRKPWAMVDCCATFTFGLGLMVIPQVVMGFQVTGGILDDAHFFLCRHIGALLIGSAVTVFICRNSYESRMFDGLFYSRVFSCTLMLIAESYSAYHLWNRKGIHFNDKYLMFACGGVGTWAFGSLVQLLRNQHHHRTVGGGFVSQRTGDRLAAGFRFDHFLLLMIGIVFFAFPAQILKLTIKKQKSTIDGVHVCLFRCIASLIIGHALCSQNAATLFTSNKKNHIVGRLTTQILMFACNIYAHFVSDLFTIYNVTPMMLSGFYITYLLILYFRCNKAATSSAEAGELVDQPTVFHQRQSPIPQQQQQELDAATEDDDDESDEKTEEGEEEIEEEQMKKSK